MRNKAPVAVCLLLMILLGCTSNQVITSITLALDAAEIALPIVAASTGISPALITQLTNYLAAVGQAFATTTDILARGEPPAQQAADITAAFAGVILPALPAGLPVAVVTAIEKVATLVSQFLATLPKPAPALTKQAAAPVLSAKDLATLKALHDRAAKLAANRKP